VSDLIEIVLVRHASTAWSGRRYCGRSDPPLSGAGRVEAAGIAARLAATLDPSTLVVSSPSRRAFATAEAIGAAAGGLAIELDTRWRETDFGRAEGLRFDELATLDPALADAVLAGSTAIDWPDGETAASLSARVAEALAGLRERGRPAVVVTHGGPILHALRLARNGEVATFDDVPRPGHEVRMTLASGKADLATVLPSRA
jgi:broad specificity phosphatase PhoE